MREGEGIFDIIVLVENRWSRFISAQSGDCSDLDCGDALLIVVLAAVGGLDWRADVDDSGRLLGDTGAGDKAINNSLGLCSARMTEVHLDIPVHIVKVVVPVGYLGDTVYCFVWKVEVGIGPFLAGLGWSGDSDHVRESNRGARERWRELGTKIDEARRAKFERVGVD